MRAAASQRMPGIVKGAMAGVWFQAVANGLGAWLLYFLMAERLEHGQEVPNSGLLWTLVVLSVIVAIVLAVCGVLARRRLNGVRITLLAVQGVALVSALIALVMGNLAAVIGLALPTLIGSTLLSEQGRDWFDR